MTEDQEKRRVRVRAARLGKTNGNGLFGGARAVHPGPDVINFFPDELTCLGRGGFALTFVGSDSSQGPLFRHISISLSSATKSLAQLDLGLIQHFQALCT